MLTIAKMGDGNGLVTPSARPAFGQFDPFAFTRLASDRNPAVAGRAEAQMMQLL